MGCAVLAAMGVAGASRASTFVSTAGTGFSQTITPNSSYAFDVDANGTNDYQLVSVGGVHLTLTGLGANTVVIGAGFRVAAFATLSDAVTSPVAATADLRTRTLIGYDTNFSAGTPYGALVLVNSLIGSLMGTVDQENGNFTLTDFGYFLPDVAAVPEPGSMALLSVGAAAMVVVRRRLKRRDAPPAP